MSKPEARSPYREASSVSSNISDRVRDRVTEAEKRLAELPAYGHDTLTTLALWQVFEEFGDSRREHRRKTGDAVIPELREATLAFRRDPSLDSLVAVAVFLDQRGLLAQSP
ncbi:MAG: hypothetical protein ACREOG_09980 [Gemmatimonadaceae bacterium]